MSDQSIVAVVFLHGVFKLRADHRARFEDSRWALVEVVQPYVSRL